MTYSPMFVMTEEVWRKLGEALYIKNRTNELKWKRQWKLISKKKYEREMFLLNL